MDGWKMKNTIPSGGGGCVVGLVFIALAGDQKSALLRRAWLCPSITVL
jgi:hypothetical protein